MDGKPHRTHVAHWAAVASLLLFLVDLKLGPELQGYGLLAALLCTLVALVAFRRARERGDEAPSRLAVGIALVPVAFVVGLFALVVVWLATGGELFS